jgi:hypothetical protein
MQREDYVAGRPMQGNPGPSDLMPLPQAVERDASQTPGSIPTPDLASLPSSTRPSIAVPANTPRVSQILGDDDDEDEDERRPGGLGPRLVVLHESAHGHPRGSVIWASDLFGTETLQAALDGEPDARRRVRRGLKRLVDLGAVRQASKHEEGYEQVIFVEDMAQAEATIGVAQAQLGQLSDENAQLRRQLEEANRRLAGTPHSDSAPGENAPPNSTNQPPRPTRAVVPSAPSAVPPAAPPTAVGPTGPPPTGDESSTEGDTDDDIPKF